MYPHRYIVESARTRTAPILPRAERRRECRANEAMTGWSVALRQLYDVAFKLQWRARVREYCSVIERPSVGRYPFVLEGLQSALLLAARSAQRIICEARP